MRHRFRFPAPLLALLLLCCTCGAQLLRAQSKPGSPAVSKAESGLHVVFALTSDDEQDWTLTVTNLRNLQKADPGIQVELVAYGPGIQFLTLESAEGSAVRSLLSSGVQMLACRHAMDARSLTQTDLIEGVRIVPSGVAEVIARQAQGWSYIKAGR